MLAVAVYLERDSVKDLAKDLARGLARDLARDSVRKLEQTYCQTAVY